MQQGHSLARHDSPCRAREGVPAVPPHFAADHTAASWPVPWASRRVLRGRRHSSSQLGRVHLRQCCCHKIRTSAAGQAAPGMSSLGNRSLPQALPFAGHTYTHSVDPAPTQYVDRDGAQLAYQVVGDGPMSLIIHLEIVQHLDLCWTDPHIHRNFERVAGLGRAVIFSAPWVRSVGPGSLRANARAAGRGRTRRHGRIWDGSCNPVRDLLDMLPSRHGGRMRSGARIQLDSPRPLGGQAANPTGSTAGVEPGRSRWLPGGALRGLQPMGVGPNGAAVEYDDGLTIQPQVDGIARAQFSDAAGRPSSRRVVFET